MINIQKDILYLILLHVVLNGIKVTKPYRVHAFNESDAVNEAIADCLKVYKKEKAKVISYDWFLSEEIPTLCVVKD